MAHDLDEEYALQNQTAVGHLLDRLIYNKLLSQLSDDWVDKLLAQDMRNRVERVTTIAMGKLLTRNYHNVNDYLASKLVNRLTKNDFAKMTEAAITAMFKEHGKELELAAKAAVQEAIQAALTKQFKQTLQGRAASHMRAHIEKCMDEAFLLPDAERDVFLKSEAPLNEDD